MPQENLTKVFNLKYASLLQPIVFVEILSKKLVSLKKPLTR